MRRAVLFDLDDTLFDHHRSSRAALQRVHAASPAADRATYEAFERHHSRFLEEMHIEVLAGRVGLDEARRERFRRVFAALGVEVTSGETASAAAAYRAGYLEARRPMPGFGTPVAPPTVTGPSSVAAANRRKETTALATNVK